MIIRAGNPTDIPLLTEIWRRSVRISHKFLSPADIDSLEPEAQKGFGELELWVGEVGGIAAGFMAMNGTKIEALFIDPAYIGKGLGSRFIEHAKTRLETGAKLLVDVNEGNPEAKGFYLAKGFRQVGRSATDSAGRPWPLLHLLMSVE